jgi:hypothetical protein
MLIGKFSAILTPVSRQQQRDWGLIPKAKNAVAFHPVFHMHSRNTALKNVSVLVRQLRWTDGASNVYHIKQYLMIAGRASFFESNPKSRPALG